MEASRAFGAARAGGEAADARPQTGPPLAAPGYEEIQPAPGFDEIHILWTSEGMSCDGDTVSVTAAQLPRLEDVLLGHIPFVALPITLIVGRATPHWER